jgi:hypothetical protein
VTRWLETELRQRDAAHLAPLFLITAADPARVDPVALFTRPYWSPPFAAEPVPLLGFVPEIQMTSLNPSHYLPPEQYARFLTAIGDATPSIGAEADAG